MLSSSGKWRFVFPVLASLALWAAGAAGAGGSGYAPLRFASGPEGTVYFRLSEGVGMRVPGIQVLETRGSAENLDLLEAGEAAFALVQQDLASRHFTDNPDSRLEVVGRVFFEQLHILVRDTLHLEDPGEFRYLRTWPGHAGSGSRFTAERFLESVGVPLSNLAQPIFDEDQLALHDLPALFRSRKVDVAMIVTAAGSRIICEGMQSGDYTLFPLAHRTLRLLTSDETNSGYRRQVGLGQIPAGTYRNQPASVPTVAVPVLLITAGTQERQRVARVWEALRRAWDALVEESEAAECPIPRTVPRVGLLADSKLPIYGGYGFEAVGPQSEAHLVSVFLPLALALGALAWLALKLGWVRRLRRTLRGRIALMSVGGFVLGVLAITFTTYVVEHEINEHFSSLPEAFWSITIYLFSGLEDRNPYTFTGRAVAALGLFLGPMFFAVATGWLASLFISWERKMPKNLTNHFLILNWNERAMRVVKELHHPMLVREKSPVIVVLTDDDGIGVKELKEAGSGKDKLFEDVYLSAGDPTSEMALRNTNAEDAQTILALADDRLGERADERTIRSVVALKGIAEAARRELHLVVELIDPANESVIDAIAGDFPGLLESVCGVQIRTCMLAQAALSSGATDFYSDLLRVSPDTNEVYIVDLPEKALGMSFREYAATLFSGDSEQAIVPVGVQRGNGTRTKIYCNPRPGEPGWQLEAGDRLVLLAYEPPGKL